MRFYAETQYVWYGIVKGFRSHRCFKQLCAALGLGLSISLRFGFCISRLFAISWPCYCESVIYWREDTLFASDEPEISENVLVCKLGCCCCDLLTLCSCQCLFASFFLCIWLGVFREIQYLYTSYQYSECFCASNHCQSIIVSQTIHYDHSICNKHVYLFKIVHLYKMFHF